MNEKMIKSRFVLTHDTEANWNLIGQDFIPKAGELIIYDTDDTHSIPRYKIGNDVDNINNLPFIETLPKTQSSEEGSFLRIIGGEPTWSSVPAAETALF